LYQQSPASLSSISVSIQTEPQMFSMSQSYTLPLLTNGHAKGVTSLYTVAGNGTLPRHQLLEHSGETLPRRDSVSLRRGGQYQYPALDTKYEDTKYNESHYLVDDSKYALDTEDSKSFDHLMPSSGSDQMATGSNYGGMREVEMEARR